MNSVQVKARLLLICWVRHVPSIMGLKSAFRTFLHNIDDTTYDYYYPKYFFHSNNNPHSLPRLGCFLRPQLEPWLRNGRTAWAMGDGLCAKRSDGEYRGIWHWRPRLEQRSGWNGRYAQGTRSGTIGKTCWSGVHPKQVVDMQVSESLHYKTLLCTEMCVSADDSERMKQVFFENLLANQTITTNRNERKRKNELTNG